MTGILVLTAVVALLIAALVPAHHRADPSWRPGADLGVDRDRQRVSDELVAVAQRQGRPPARVDAPLRAARSAVTFARPARLRSH
jgi:hypothetical protein